MIFPKDERASAGSGFNFIFVLIAGGIMGIVLRVMVLPVVDMSRSETTSDVALQGVSYSETVIAYFGLAVLVTAVFYLLASAIIDRRLGV